MTAGRPALSGTGVTLTPSLSHTGEGVRAVVPATFRSIFVLDYMPNLCCCGVTSSPMGSCGDHRLSSGRKAVLRGVLGGMPPGHRSDPWVRLVLIPVPDPW